MLTLVRHTYSKMCWILAEILLRNYESEQSKYLIMCNSVIDRNVSQKHSAH